MRYPYIMAIKENSVWESWKLCGTPSLEKIIWSQENAENMMKVPFVMAFPIEVPFAS